MDIRDEVLDELLSGCEKPEDLPGDDGLLKRLKKERWSWFLRPRDRSPKVEAGTVSCFC